MKFIPTILTLLLAAPSAADLLSDTHPRRDRKLGGVGGKSSKPTRIMTMTEEVEVEVDVAEMQKPSCAATYPVVAVEQFVVASALTFVAGYNPWEISITDVPSLNAMLGGVAPSNKEEFFLEVNRIFAEMSCGDYEKQEKYSTVLSGETLGYFFFGMPLDKLDMGMGGTGFFNSTFTPEPEDSSP